jgi:hypothetical protein
LLLVLLYEVYRRLKYRGGFFPSKQRRAFMGLVNANCLLFGLPSTSKNERVTMDKQRNAPTIPVTFIINTEVSLVSTPKQCNRNNVILCPSEHNRLLLFGFAKFTTRQNR